MSGFFALPVRRAPTQSRPPNRRPPQRRKAAAFRLQPVTFLWQPDKKRPLRPPVVRVGPSCRRPSALYPPSRPLFGLSFDHSAEQFPFSVGFCWCDVPGFVVTVYLPRRVSLLSCAFPVRALPGPPSQTRSSGALGAKTGQRQGKDKAKTAHRPPKLHRGHSPVRPKQRPDPSPRSPRRSPEAAQRQRKGRGPHRDSGKGGWGR